MVADLFSATADKLADVICGWENMGSFKYPCDVREFLTYQEARELLMMAMHNQHVTPEEKKS